MPGGVATTLRRGAVLTAVTLVALPALLAGLSLWSFGDRLGDVEDVPAAVVNLDRPVRTGTGEDRQIVAAGRLLAAGLTSPADPVGPTLDWEVTTAAAAEQGLADGRYRAVVTIPRDFSRTVAGLAEDDPRRARVTVRTADGSGPLLRLVGGRVTDVALDRVGRRVTTTYLQGLYERSAGLATRLSVAGDGAARVATGAERLRDGTGRLSSGAGDLAQGVGELRSGADRLTNGAGTVARGAERAAAGARRLQAGAAEARGGAGRLAGGLAELRDRTRDLPEQTDRLADGASEVRDGVAGWAQVLRGWKTACTSDPVLAARHARLCAATVQAVGATGGNADALTSGSARVAEGARGLADAAPALAGGIDDAADGASRLRDGLTRLDDGADRLRGGAEELAAGSARLQQGATRLSDGAATASDAAARIADGSGRLQAGSERLGSGSQVLAEGLRRGAAQVPDYSPAERRELARTVAQPVAADTLPDDASGRDVLAPAVTALALWLGALGVALARRPRAAGPASRARATPASPARVVLAGWWPAAVIGGLQAALLLLGSWLLGVAAASPVAGLLTGAVAAASFAALHQALLAAVRPTTGVLASVALAVVQGAALAALLPAGSGPLQLMGGALPVPLAANALASALGGEALGAAGPVVGLVAWAGLGLLLAAQAARRRARVTPSDVRRLADAPA